MVKTGPTALDQGGRTSDIDALFLSLGQLGRDLRAVDWAATPLGPPTPMAAKPEIDVTTYVDVTVFDVDGVGPAAHLLC